MKSKKAAGDRGAFTLDRFEFENRQTLENIQIYYETWGKLNPRRDNAVLIAHALTGSSRVTRMPDDETPGWWEALVGPGKAFDTHKYFVVCANVLGGCSGSSGPASINPQTGAPYGVTFPVVTIRDMVRSQRRLLEQLGVRKLKTVAGGSMGGMQALEWAVLYPDMVESIIPVVTPGRVYPQSIAFRKAQRKAIMMDPLWSGGNYDPGIPPKKGLELARFIGFISYRTEQEFARRFGRNFVDEELVSLEGRFEIEQYLEYHGRKLAEWFDANTYLYLSKAMDLHDLGYGCISYEVGVQRIKAAVLMVGIDSDILFPTHQQKEVVDILQKTNPEAHYREIKSLYGHDGFLIETEQLSNIVCEFLETITCQFEEKRYALSN